MTRFEGAVSDPEQARRAAELAGESVRCAQALGFPAWRAKHPPDPAWDPEWTNIVFVRLPTGQCSWHIHDSELPSFAFLDLGAEPWDGHTTAEKYARLAAWCPPVKRGRATKRKDRTT